jgi:hypothetical protein
MALETYYTFSADTLKAEIASGKYTNLRHFMFGGMGNHYEATTPQRVFFFLFVTIRFEHLCDRRRQTNSFEIFKLCDQAISQVSGPR